MSASSITTSSSLLADSVIADLAQIVAKSLGNVETFLQAYEGRRKAFDPSIFTERDWTQNIPNVVYDLVIYYLDNVRGHGAYDCTVTRRIVKVLLPKINRYVVDQIARITFATFREELSLPEDGVMLLYNRYGSLIRYVLIPVSPVLWDDEHV